MGGITKLGLVLLLVFIFSILGFAAELLYVLYYRRRLSRATSAYDPELPGRADNSQPSPTKEILHYLLCWKNHSRIEPASASAAASPVLTAAVPVAAKPPCPEAAEDVDLARWRAVMFGQCRMLYTIKEEDREGAESEAGAGGQDEEDEDEDEDEMQFSTPFGSPDFYTPASSPARASVEVAA